MKINKLNGYLLRLTIALSLYIGAAAAAAETVECWPAESGLANIGAKWSIELDKTEDIMSVGISKGQTKLVDNLKPTGIFVNSSTNFSHITWIYGSSKDFFWSLEYKSTASNSSGEVETWEFYGKDSGANTYKAIKLYCKKTSPVKWSSMTYKKAMDVLNNDGIKVSVKAIRMSYGRCYLARNFLLSHENLAFGWDWDNTKSRLITTLEGGALKSSLDTKPQKPIKSITVDFIPEFKPKTMLDKGERYNITYKGLIVTSPEWTAWNFSVSRGGADPAVSLLLCLVSDTPFSDYIHKGELLSREAMPIDDVGEIPDIKEKPNVYIHLSPDSKSGSRSSDRSKE
ncbi:MAG: hypothetical protein K0R94_1155 [Burkholderiales bacterium]|jgi:hypothetical protein|nr:hypothetical protein [Burkholderiales bacterium]